MLHYFFAHLPLFLWNLFTFVTCLCIIIILHELSHFLVSKLSGCGVSVVSLGFGKPFYSFYYKDTRYNFCYLLLGGYCSLKDETINNNAKDSFSNLPYLKKFMIAVAGCVMNIIIGLIAFALWWKFNNYYLIYFSVLSIGLGITNLIPVIPCLDGGYIFYIPILTKIYGREKGYSIFNKINSVSFKIMLVLNILSLPYMIWLIWKGIL